MIKFLKTAVTILIAMLASCSSKPEAGFFNPTTLDYVLSSHAAGSQDIFLNTNIKNISFNVTEGSGWLDAVRYDDILTVSYSENPASFPRTGSILVSAGQFQKTFTLTQPGKPADPEPEPEPEPEGYRVVGYLPSGSSGYTPVWDKLDVINLSFARVNSDGSLKDSDVRKAFAKFADTAHERDVKVVVSLGGASMLKEFDAAIVSEQARQKTIEDCVKLMADLHLDGIDVDYESWGWGKDSGNKVRAEGFLALVKGLRAALGKDALLTAALMGNTIENGWYTMEMFNELDYITLMAYDRTSGKVGPHSAFEYFSLFAQIALDMGMPAKKIIPGVPFYGYQFKDNNPSSHTTPSYKQIVATYPGAENMDAIESEHLYYDGIPMMTRKCNHVVENGLGGIMIWQIAGDATEDNKSLLTVIDRILKAEE